jgi:hypothetical protein
MRSEETKRKDKARSAAWYVANRERSKALNAAWAAANPERVKAIQAAWRAANPDRDKEQRRRATDRWQDAHPQETRDVTRRRDAKRGGYLPPPPESECPPRTDHCQYCHKPMDPAIVYMDHNHKTGAFRAWCCHGCNVRVS